MSAYGCMEQKNAALTASIVSIIHVSRIIWAFLLQSEITSLHWDPTGHMLITTGASCKLLKVWKLGYDSLQLAHSLAHETVVTCALWYSVENLSERSRLVLARFVKSLTLRIQYSTEHVPSVVLDQRKPQTKIKQTNLNVKMKAI